MLVKKEVISPAMYWYKDQQTNLPRKLNATPDLIRYWNDEGNKMLSLGLTVPVPFEHDFNAHPMTPAEKLINNAGWVKEYRIENGTLFSIVDIQDENVAKKLPKTIRWTSPWISSFTDGAGRAWNNVISHLALTTRPRIIKQAPFQSIAAAMAFAMNETPVALDPAKTVVKDGIELSRAGRLKQKDGKLLPAFPIAFSLWAGGIPLSPDDTTPSQDEGGKDVPKPDGTSPPMSDDDTGGDLQISAVLGQLLDVLNVQMPDGTTDENFMKQLLPAVIAAIKAQGGNVPGNGAKMDNDNQPNTGRNDLPQNPYNPLIQQEQQPMYMSLEAIQKIPDATMRDIAMSMYTENMKQRAALDQSNKELSGLRTIKLNEENAKRQLRVERLCRMSPSLKEDLTKMFSARSMALSLGDGGTINDPMAQTLTMLEKGLQDIPKLLTTPADQIVAMSQPTDDSQLTSEESDKIAAMLIPEPRNEQKKAS